MSPIVLATVAVAALGDESPTLELTGQRPRLAVYSRTALV